MRHFFYIMIVISCSALQAFAQDTTGGKVKEYSLQEIVITEHRQTSPENQSILAREAVTAREIPYITVNSAAYVLQTFTGMDFKDYGGVHNMKMLSFRGSTSEQTTVLINGMPVNSPASGLIDISLIPLQNIQKIEVFRSGTVSQYAQPSIGGGVNIVTGPMPIKKKSYNQVRLQATSFDQRTVDWTNYIKHRGWISTIHLSKEFQPDSSYQVNDPNTDKKVFRVNTQTDKNVLTWNLSSNVNRFKYSFFTQWISRHNEIPNTIDNNSGALSKAKQFDRLVIVNPQVQYSRSNQINFQFSGSYVHSDLNYSNALSGIHSGLRTNSYGISSTTECLWPQDNSTVIRYSYFHSQADGTLLSSTISSHHALYGSQLLMCYLPDVLFFDRLIFNPAAGLDFENHYGESVSPKANVYFYRDYQRSLLFIRGAFASNFRYPTFNERFWNGDGGLGNPDIKPEHGYVMEGGAGWQQDDRRWGKFKAEVNLFHSQTKRQIVWQPGVLEPGVWTPVNLTQTRNNGYEISIEHHYDSLATRIIFIRSRPVDTKQYSSDRRLPYTPLYTVKITNQWRTRQWLFFHSTRYYSERFIDLQNADYLKPYWLTDIMIQYVTEWNGIDFAFELSFRNIFDAVYEPVALYPGLSREFSLGVTFGF